ncbi:MAG: hypothetical protein IBX68_08655 [Dehalococcoidia bacterium]|nr:hypothetical protein [Dehalococcoidia bacterium]
MIRLTEMAATVLFESLRASGIHPNWGLRVKEEAGTFKLQLDTPRPNDRVIRRNEAVVLIVDRTVEEEVGNALIDLEDDLEEPQLVMRKRLARAAPAWQEATEWRPLMAPRYVPAN